METVQEKIAYLRGLIAGSDFFGKDQRVREVWSHLLEIVDDLGHEIALLSAEHEDMQEYIDAIDDDLFEVQEDIYGDTWFDADSEWVRYACPHCGYDLDHDVADSDILNCPHCGREVYLDEPEYDLPVETEMDGYEEQRLE
ncbi:MAG: hypothetical protein GX030_10420 [Firmicutes bacterium]|nr:hypothetical protein [Bacillota bacterium]